MQTFGTGTVTDSLQVGHTPGLSKTLRVYTQEGPLEGLHGQVEFHIIIIWTLMEM